MASTIHHGLFASTIVPCYPMFSTLLPGMVKRPLFNDSAVDLLEPMDIDAKTVELTKTELVRAEIPAATKKRVRVRRSSLTPKQRRILAQVNSEVFFAYKPIGKALAAAVDEVGIALEA
ncbi:hypothetical protein HKX48_004008 [Thoreauomyces humboldtii]|nr:hypothetical protein HKX48_004008 [Thoreauomyces humboldtii]